jgi:chemotaxis protein methyltransferase WspC
MNAEPRIDARFESWLLRETGISAPTLGVHAFERAVWERVRATRDGDLDAYWQWLNASHDERQALIERIVVPETWFFRDREAFVALARLANERLVRHPAHVLRVLSAPCSSGEEPYSIAMALLDAGIGPERFAIDAVDISERALEVARRGVYGRNSFRGRALEFRERHFSAAGLGAAGSGTTALGAARSVPVDSSAAVSDALSSATADARYTLSERVRNTVRFIQANLFDAPQPADPRFDFIFCRNVLIYFDRDAQDRAIRLLDARLTPDGMLFVGPAETGLMMRHAFNPARIPLAFAFRRSTHDDALRPQHAQIASAIAGALPIPRIGTIGPIGPIEPITPVRPVRPVPPRRQPRVAEPGDALGHRASPEPHASSASAFAPASGVTTQGAARTHTMPFSMASQSSQSSQPSHVSRVAASDTPAVHAEASADPHAKLATLLAEASRLADAGRLDQAERVANQCVVVHGPQAAVFHLLGLIMDARGHGADAGDYYRKALYLEPDHYEALTHLAALLEMTGDTSGAERLTRRAERAARERRDTPERSIGRTRGLHD